MWTNFTKFRQIFKNTFVSKNDIGDSLKTYAEEEGTFSQPRKKLISIFTSEKRTLIGPLLSFYLELGLVGTKIHRFIQNTPRKSFNSLVQSTVDVRKLEDKNSNSSVVAETMNLLLISSHDYQIKDRSQQTVSKYLKDGKTDAAIISKLFKKLHHVNISLYLVGPAKPQIEHKEPIIVGFNILQYGKLRELELYYNFFTKFCDVN